MSRDKQNFFKTKFVTELKPLDFDSKETWKLNNHKCSIVLFYAPWCPYCKNVKDEWLKLGKTAAFFDVCAFNCEKYRGHLDKIKEEMPGLIQGFPTMIIYEKGKPLEKTGTDETSRKAENFIKACMRTCKDV